MNKLGRKLSATLCSLVLAFATVGYAQAADVVLINFDPPGAGLNDPTPATPVGGNPGETVGDQRINVYLEAARRWGETLESSVPILVGATFQPLPCAAGGGVLGAAGPTFVNWIDGPSPVPGIEGNTIYHIALFNALAGFDLVPGNIHIISFFNSELGTEGCLENSSWYYGLDNNQPAGSIDFLSTVSHEIAHGLGFSEFASESTGALLVPERPSIYARNMFDTAQGKSFADMTDAERLIAQVSGDNLVWTGDSVTAAAPSVLGPRPSVKVLRPKELAGFLDAQQASFGPSLRLNGGMTGQVVLADDGEGVGTDACEPIKNNVNGKIALIDRGGCAFVTKVLNAQAAGAKGAMVANNQPGGPAPMGGFSPFVTIPSVGLTLDQGNAFKDAGKVNVKLILNPYKLAGANDDGLVQLYGPNPVQPGSSKSHWDTSATPNLLMEPSITPDLESATTFDLTPNLFEDLGWILQ